MIAIIGLLCASGIILAPIIVWIKTKGQNNRVLKVLGASLAFFIFTMVMIGIDPSTNNTSQAQTAQKIITQTKEKSQPKEQSKTADDKSPKQSTQDAGNQESSIAREYKAGEIGILGVVMTESLIQYLSEAEKNPVKTKYEAEGITKEIYNDITDKDGTIMPEKEMMVKLYQAQIYYDKNMNSEYSSVNGLLIEEFGGRINKTRGVSGAAERMNNISTMYEMVRSLHSY